MNDTAQIIVAIATLITSVGAVVMSFINRGTLKTVQAQTNGMMEKLGIASEAKGNLAGRAEAKLEGEHVQKVEVTKIPPLG